MTQSKAHGDYFEQVMEDYDDPKMAGNWIMGELSAYLNADNKDITDAPVSPRQLGQMLALINDGTISGKIAKAVFKTMYATGKSPAKIIEDQGLTQISGEDEIGAIVETVMNENSQAVEEYRSGKKQALGFLVGQVMRLSKGKANPGKVNEILGEKLKS